MQNFNNNLLDTQHYIDWNSKLGNNFTNQYGIHNYGMYSKNIETEGSYQAKVSGDYGEFTAKSVLNSLPDIYAVMNDILIQTGIKYRPYQPEKYGQSPWKIVRNKKNSRLYEEVHKSTQLDHIIVSPFGIFVLETKNHKGWVYGDISGRVWTQVLNGEQGNGAYGGHSHYTFLNPVLQNQEHIRHLSNSMKLSSAYMTGMIVFTNPDAHLANVNCNCCFTMDMLYEAILSYTNVVFNPKQYEKVIHAIERIDSNNYTLEKEHITYVKDIQHRQEVNKIYRR